MKYLRCSPEDLETWNPIHYQGRECFLVRIEHGSRWSVVCGGAYKEEYLPFVDENDQLIPVLGKQVQYRKNFAEEVEAIRMYDRIQHSLTIRSLVNRLGFKTKP